MPTSLVDRAKISRLGANDLVGDQEHARLEDALYKGYPPSPSSLGTNDNSIISPNPSSWRNAKELNIANRVTSSRSRVGTPSGQQVLLRNYIREDYVSFIEMNLPYWKEHGLWFESALSDPHQRKSGYESLETIYSCMCELDKRMDHDPIRKHAALVILDSRYKGALEDWKSHKPKRSKQSIGVGRGNASAMIDNILSNMHPDWDMFEPKKRSELRAKFHDERRYGNRWSILVASAGPSILFLCSPQLAKMVYVLLFNA